MKFPILALLVLSLALVPACNGASDDGTTPERTPAATGTPAPAPAGELTGRVAETMDSGGYTYIALDVGGKRIWAAGPETEVSVGDTVSIPKGMEQRNFHSNTLDRTFESILFVGAIRVAGAPGATSPHAGTPPAGSPHAADAKVTGIEPLEGGQTVAEIVGKRADLAGEEIAVRGKVVKFNRAIMGTNWLHIQDGTGDAADGTNDLAVTTDAVVNVGDVVVVRGTVTVEKDFGAGYSYEVIVEKADVTKE